MLINNNNLIIFNVRNSKVDLNENFVYNKKNANARKLQNSNGLKWYETRFEK